MLQQIDLNCIQKDKLELDLESPHLKSFKKANSITEEYEEATSPCLMKKRMVQKGGFSTNSNEQLITDLRFNSESDVETNSINKESKSQGSSSLQFENLITELNIFQNKSNEQTKMGFRKAKKVIKQEKSLDKGQTELTYTSLQDQINIINKQTDELKELPSYNGQNIDYGQLHQQNIQKQKSLQSNENQQQNLEKNDKIEGVQKQIKNQQYQEDLESKDKQQLSVSQKSQSEIEEEDDADNQQSSEKLEISQQEKALKQLSNNQGNGGNKKTRTCNCKKTKCLKLYCDCFAAGEFCGGQCNCCDCSNTQENKEARNKIIEGLLEKNPFAFNAVKEIEPEELSQLSFKTQKQIASKKGCNCRRSGCLKKYCQCYQDGLQCSEHCKCDGCENCEKPKNLLFGEQNSIQGQSKKLIQNESLKINTQPHILQQNFMHQQKLSNSSKQNSNNISINSIQQKHSNQGSFLQSHLNILQQQNLEKQNQNRFGKFNIESTNNNPFNIIKENTQQLMLTQLLTNMVNQQTQILNNPLIQLAAMQASLQQMLVDQQQRQQTSNNIDKHSSSIQNMLMSAAATTSNNINQLFNYLL